MAHETPPLFEDPTEPLFILRGSDPTSYLTLVMWACLKDKHGDSQSAQQGTEIALAMEAYARRRGMDADQAFNEWVQFISEAHPKVQAFLNSVIAERVQLGQRIQ